MLDADILFNAYGITDQGRRRRLNEDAFVCNSDQAIFLVVDGMGGENYGEVASQLTAEYFTKMISPLIVDEEATIPFEHSVDEDFFLRAVIHAAEGANAAVIDFADENPTHRGMGSTLTAAVFHNACLYVAHVGDSRLYRIREGRIEQLTKDHTRVQEMVDKGILEAEEAKTHPQRHVLTRCAGRKRQFQPDVLSVDITEKDICLICSDGLHDMVDEKEIHRIVVQSDTFENAGNTLIETANQNGGKDNITLVLFQLMKNQGPEDTA